MKNRRQLSLSPLRATPVEPMERSVVHALFRDGGDGIRRRAGHTPVDCGRAWCCRASSYTGEGAGPGGAGRGCATGRCDREGEHARGDARRRWRLPHRRLVQARREGYIFGRAHQYPGDAQRAGADARTGDSQGCLYQHARRLL